MNEMEQFYTRDASNEGIKLPLAAASGDKTDHYLNIRGFDSDAFRDSEAEARRTIINAGADGAADAAKEGRLDMIASLVIGWSFKTECNPDNVKEFLKKSPQIADEVERIAGDRALFFALKSKGSKATRKKK